MPKKTREVWRVVIWCRELKRVTFLRRGIETPYDNPNIFTGKTYPPNKGNMKQIEPDHGVKTAGLRRALKTQDFKPSIDLENNLEIWEVRE